MAQLVKLETKAPIEPMAAAGTGRPRPGVITLTEPLGYIDFLRVMAAARLVLTDSGGVQEETTCLGVPCLSLRRNTERPVTTELGTTVLAGTDPDQVLKMTRAALNENGKTATLPPLWDGHAAERIVQVLVDRR
jgi:UDP-N-acetylglucosamine 2-epimerase (non-hydrolysing)